METPSVAPVVTAFGGQSSDETVQLTPSPSQGRPAAFLSQKLAAFSALNPSLVANAPVSITLLANITSGLLNTSTISGVSNNSASQPASEEGDLALAIS